MTGAPEDRVVEIPVVEQEVLVRGRIFNVNRDVVDLGEYQVVREYLDHPGAVAVIALDDEDRVLLLEQYRHPVRSMMWEPPAGLRDVQGEPEVMTAIRELAEEADLTASSWWRLVELYSTPGSSSEHVTVFLARGLAPTAVPFARVDEEATMVPVWVPMDDVVDAIFAGRVLCPTVATGVMAAYVARQRGWVDLEPVVVDL